MRENLSIVKYGGRAVSGEHGMDSGKIDHYTPKLACLNETNEIIVVSSGAVAVGRFLWEQRHGASDEVSDQSLAMLGSANVVKTWQDSFAKLDLLAGQLLITHREIEDPQEKPALVRALERNLGLGIITVANENDALSEEELAKLAYGGDNDGLASHLARVMGASCLFLLTETNGLLDGQSRVVQRVEYNTYAHNRARSYSHGRPHKGRGGMRSKVDAAIKAADSGIDAYIAGADEDFEAILAGEVGTYFMRQHGSEEHHVE